MHLKSQNPAHPKAMRLKISAAFYRTEPEINYIMNLTRRVFVPSA